MFPLPFLSFPLLCIAVSLIIRRAYYATKRAETHNGTLRPPLMASWIPFVGNALDMAGGDHFWVRAVEKYGPAFRITAVGETRTFVTTPALIQHVYKNSKTFDFVYFRKHFQDIIFGMEREKAMSPAMNDKVFDRHHKDMQPKAIEGAISRYVDQLEECLSRFGEGLDKGREVDIVKEVYEIIYTASAKAWFSPSFPTAETLAPFIKFDKFVPVLNLTSVPDIIRSPATNARKEILRRMEEWWTSTGEDERSIMAPALLGMFEVSESEGWSVSDWATTALAELWALEANAPLSAIWIIVEILRQPQLLKVCRDEIETAIKTNGGTLSKLLHQPPSTLPTLLPVINAAFQETLRYHTSSYSLRLVQEDTILPAYLLGTDSMKGTSSGTRRGQGYALKKGEEVVCVSRHNQVDGAGDWGSNACAWDHTRFMGKEGRGSMMPFGGGVSMCEGRHFASAEILTFLASFIHRFDFDTQPVTDTVRPDMQRIGLGVMNFKGEMRVRTKPRHV